jgi:hypothetical protein
MTVGGAAISEMFIRHDNFTAAILKHNIALVKLRDRLTFNGIARIILLQTNFLCTFPSRVRTARHTTFERI